MKIIKFLTFLILATAATSCQTSNPDRTPFQRDRKADLSEIRINAANPLLADMTAWDLTDNLATRSFSDEDYVLIESLLDKNSTISVNSEDGIWHETKFIDNEETFVFVSDEMSADYEQFQSSKLRKYLIEAPDGYFLVTMIPYYPFSGGDWDYFHMQGFYGKIIYSTLDGEFLEMEEYNPSRGMDIAFPITDPENYKNVEYINITTPGTKASMYGGELDASICVSQKGLTINDYMDSKDWNYNKTGTSKNSGGGNNGKTPNNKRPVTYSVTLNIQGDGSVSGAGKYNDGAVVEIMALPDNDSKFIYWTGDISSNDARLKIIVSRNINVTAVFTKNEEKQPCFNATNGTYFPIGGEKKVAPVEKGRAPSSGLYGNYRWNKDGTPKAHNGWDILATPGTPFYAPIRGIISNDIISNIPNGKEGKIGKGSGNRIGITFYLNGTRYDMYFFHMNYTDRNNPGARENGIGINPRTGTFWQAGDEIYPGEMIGCTGSTGYACDVTYKHLHVELHKNGIWKNYEDPAIIFGNVVSNDSFDIDFPCDEINDQYTFTEIYDWLAKQ